MKLYHWQIDLTKPDKSKRGGKMRVTTVSIDDLTFEGLRKLAFEDHSNISETVRRAIKHYVEFRVTSKNERIESDQAEDDKIIASLSPEARKILEDDAKSKSE